VMYWWYKAAALTGAGHARRFGFITTNSIRQTFNRRVVRAALDGNLYLTFAIPDHPWVDTAEGAAVRIAMTVGAPKSSVVGPDLGQAAKTTGARGATKVAPCYDGIRGKRKKWGKGRGFLRASAGSALRSVSRPKPRTETVRANLLSARGGASASCSMQSPRELERDGAGGTIYLAGFYSQGATRARSTPKGVSGKEPKFGLAF